MTPAPTIFIISLACFFLLIIPINFVASNEDDEFIFNGFNRANLTLDGNASITSNGLLRLTNGTTYRVGHGFHSHRINFRRNPAGAVLSFSTTFVFAIRSDYTHLSANGLAFTISPTTDFSTALGVQYMGLFNLSNIGNPNNHIFAVELDTIKNPEFRDIDDNHVGININSMKSNASHTAGYYGAPDTSSFTNLPLNSGNPMQVWIDYDGKDMRVDVTMSPVGTGKPNRPLLSSSINLSTVILDSMYVGFSSATGSVVGTFHYILGWSFKMNGVAQPLNLTNLPSLPPIPSVTRNKHLSTWVPVAASVVSAAAIAAAIVFMVKRKRKYAELLEDWEIEYGPHRIPFKDLYTATKGFKDKEVLGVGGFGRVYRGVLPASGLEVAVKRVSQDSRQGMKEFIAEIVSIGRLRHRNIVQLLGYCRRKGELLLVYDYMPNGSLDKYLHHHGEPTLNWAQRFRVIKGVASGLLYLHEDWEQVVLHRDIKGSNVLLDGDMNGRLGDFGLARLYDHGTRLQTTRVVGTMGYLAPELVRTGKASTSTDVYAFGVFLLEVACGRRPLGQEGEGEMVMGDWVMEKWKQGSILETRDPRLCEEFAAAEMEMGMVLKLGLLCSHPLPMSRPSMRQVMQFLDGHVPLPELLPTCMSYGTPAMLGWYGDSYNDYVLSYPCPSVATGSFYLSGGR